MAESTEADKLLAPAIARKPASVSVSSVNVTFSLAMPDSSTFIPLWQTPPGRTGATSSACHSRLVKNQVSCDFSSSRSAARDAALDRKSVVHSRVSA